MIQVKIRRYVKKLSKINQNYYIKGKMRIRTFEISAIVNFKTTNTMNLHTYILCM